MATTAPRYVCIHGHFYQPPRENPWLEAVEVQDTAAPYHDWNERITRECYAPNGRSRIVDAPGKILHLSNNYLGISFNFGPTLLSWMAEAAPKVLESIVEADRLSRQRRRGHGNAIAQVYNHAILPLAGQRDKRTQVQWGIADFRHRFGRDPEGMWLAETAADVASLEALAEAGIRFTILSPRQAKRWRPIGKDEWISIPEGIDPSRAYRCGLPSGRSIAVFFFDAVISRHVAFEHLLDSCEKFLAQLKRGFDDSRQHAQLVHIATDGETYGHHHAHGDMALAAILFHLKRDPSLRLTNYGEFLELHPPEWEVEIHENSSWSCVHGVERWRSNCGCNMGGGQQEWRAPLRQAMDHFKGRLDRLFERVARKHFADPWSARDGYIDVILDRSAPSFHRFLGKHAHKELDGAAMREVLWLLEMQRHGMLMFTSCGWFFDEISGLEATQCLHYAARAMQLARHFDEDFEEEFVKILEKAPSNVLEIKNGRRLWDQMIRPAKIDLDRVLAHYAISLVYHRDRPESKVYYYDVECLDHEVRSRGASHLAVGRLKVRSRLTSNEAETAFVVLHYGGLDFHCVLRRGLEQRSYDRFKVKIFSLYKGGSLADVTALVAQEFGGEPHRLDDLFVEEQRRIIGIILKERFEEYEQAFERLADRDEDVLNILGRLHYPIPKPLRAAASACLDRRLRQEIERLGTSDSLARLDHLLERGRGWGYQIEKEALARAIERELHNVLGDINSVADLPSLTAHAGKLLDAAARLMIPVDLWEAQNRLLDAAAGLTSPEARQAIGRLALRLRLSPELLGWRP